MTIKGKIKNSIENGYSIMSRFENDVKRIRNIYGDCKDEILDAKSKKLPFAEILTSFRTARHLQAFSRGLRTTQ